jgi:hypothetical protein
VNKSFQSVQSEFVNAIKDPSSYQRRSDEESRRMEIYQSLFFNNIDNFVSTAFPVLKSIVIKLYGEKGWESLVRQFFIEHECRSPYFAEISKEFVEYLSCSPELAIALPIFSAELAHYEWLELDVSIRSNDDTANFYEEGQNVAKLKVSPYASLAGYSYAVHLIGDDYMPEATAPEQQFYVVYRDAQCDVQFANINPVTAILLNTLEQQESGATFDDLSKLLEDQLPQIPKDALVSGMHQTIAEMLQKGIVMPVSVD